MNDPISDAMTHCPVVLYSLLMGPEPAFSYFSENIWSLLRISPEEVIGDVSRWLDKVHPADKESAGDWPVSGGRSRCEYRVKRGDFWVWVCDHRNAVLRGDGRVEVSGALTVFDENKRDDYWMDDEQTLYMEGPTMVFRWGMRDGWPVEYASPNVESILGYSPEELLSGEVPFSSLIHGEDLKRVVQEVEEALAGKKKRFTHEPYRVISRGGGTCWIYDHTIILSDDKGGESSFLGYLVDITPQKEAEEKLAKEKERLNLVIEGTNVGLWDWNLKTNEVVFNERWAEIIGYTLSELEPLSIETWMSHVHPGDLEKSNRLLEQHMAGKTDFYECECRMKHRDGYWVWVLDRGKVVEWDGEGNPLRMAGTHADVTGRKQNEERLRREDERLRKIIQTSLDGFFIVDSNGSFQDANRAYCEMIGYSREELLSLSIPDVEANESPEETTQHIEKIMREGADLFVTRQRRKNGEAIDLEVSVTLLVSDEGQSLVTFCRDITEDLAIRNKLYETNQKLESFFSQSLDGFFFMMIDEPVRWDNSVDKEKVLDYVFEHQRITKINRALLEQYRAEETDLLGLRPVDFFSHDLKQGRELWRNLFDSMTLHIDTTEKRFDGTDMIIEGDYVCLADRYGRIQGHFGIQRDVTEGRKAEERLREEKEKFRQLAENIEEVFWLRSRDEMIYVNKVYEKLWGRSVESLYENPSSFIDGVHPEDRDNVIKRFASSQDSFDMEYRIIRPDGGIRWVWARSFPIRDSEGKITRSAGIAEDITVRKNYEERLREVSIRDSLTNLFNRGHILERLEEHITISRRSGQDICVAVLDLDHFKGINDTYGHQAGDRVLVSFARILEEDIREYDLVGRYGGEEFIVLLPATTLEQARGIMERTLEKVRGREIIHEKNRLTVTFSGGVASLLEDNDSETADRLIASADRRLYQAKEEGRNRIISAG